MNARIAKSAAKTSAKPVKTKIAAPTFAMEKSYRGHVCGVDEAGRGPWAGPVCASAVILNPKHIPKGINDSKKLSHAARERLEEEIKTAAVAWGVAFASVEEIEELNILHATGLAMCRAVEMLDVAPVIALVDGNYRFKLPCDVRTVVQGDGHCLSIAAASILAKTARDRLMLDLDAQYPGYHFAAHKGYGAPKHIEALKTLGPSPVHRASWAPIKLAMAGQLVDAMVDPMGDALNDMDA